MFDVVSVAPHRHKYNCFFSSASHCSADLSQRTFWCWFWFPHQNHLSLHTKITFRCKREQEKNFLFVFVVDHFHGQMQMWERWQRKQKKKHLTRNRISFLYRNFPIWIQRIYCNMVALCLCVRARVNTIKSSSFVRFLFRSCDVLSKIVDARNSLWLLLWPIFPCHKHSCIAKRTLSLARQIQLKFTLLKWIQCYHCRWSVNVNRMAVKIIRDAHRTFTAVSQKLKQPREEIIDRCGPRIATAAAIVQRLGQEGESNSVVSFSLNFEFEWATKRIKWERTFTLLTQWHTHTSHTAHTIDQSIPLWPDIDVKAYQLPFKTCVWCQWRIQWNWIFAVDWNNWNFCKQCSSRHRCQCDGLSFKSLVHVPMVCHGFDFIYGRTHSVVHHNTRISHTYAPFAAIWRRRGGSDTKWNAMSHHQIIIKIKSKMLFVRSTLAYPYAPATYGISRSPFPSTLSFVMIYTSWTTHCLTACLIDFISQQNGYIIISTHALLVSKWVYAVERAHTHTPQFTQGNGNNSRERERAEADKHLISLVFDILFSFSFLFYYFWLVSCVC